MVHVTAPAQFAIGTQLLHAVFDVDVHAALTYSPDAHVLHEVQIVSAVAAHAVLA